MGLDVFSGIATQQGQAAQASYQAAVARNSQAMAQRNAEIEDRTASNAEQRGVVAADQVRQKAAALIGSQRARLASQGGDINDGSAVDLIGDTARAGAFDALDVRNAAAWDRYRHQLAAMNAQNQANLAGAEGDYDVSKAGSALANLPWNVASSLLGDAVKVAGKFYLPKAGT